MPAGRHILQLAHWEALERRRMLSANGAAWPDVTSVPQSDGGLELQVLVTGGEHIKIQPAAGGLQVKSHGVIQVYPGDFTSASATAQTGDNRIQIGMRLALDAVVQGGSGNDTLIAGAGDDVLYAGAGQDSLVAGSGVDTLVATGGATDTLTGGAGLDSFWANSGDMLTNISKKEKKAGAVHWLSDSASLSAVDESAASDEPAIPQFGVTYQSFAGDPLFGPNGPSPDDVVQGDLGDCYFLATLAAVAKADPNQIRQDIVQLSDGTFEVRFQSSGKFIYENVDAELPVFANSQLAYAQLGADNSLWVAVMEKAFAVFRYGNDTYADLDSGWMDEAYSDLGLVPTDTDASPESSTSTLLSLIQTDLAQKEVVTIGVLGVPPGSPLVSYHAYSVDSVVVDASGAITGLTIRNPWGVGGEPGDIGQNGYVTITPAQAAGIFDVTAAPA
jgi:Ca2+-binding RTX toxin-like protein